MKRVKFLLLVLFFKGKLLSGNTSFVEAVPIEFDPDQIELLKEDFPLKEIKLLEKPVLWILGQNFLWRFTIEKKELEQIKFEQEMFQSFEIQSVLQDKNTLYLASDKNLFQIVDDEKLLFYSYKSLFENKTVTRTLEKDPLGFIHWITNHGIQTINPLTKEVSDIKELSLPEEPFFYAFEQNKIFFLRNNHVLEKSISHKKENLLLDTKEKLSLIESEDSFLYVFGSGSLFIFDFQGNFVQKIPVKDMQNLLAAKVTKKVDAYFFKDHILEVHNKEKKKSTHYSLKSFKQEKIISFDLNKEYVVTRSKKNISLFRLGHGL